MATVFQYSVLYIRYVLITGVLISDIYCTIKLDRFFNLGDRTSSLWMRFESSFDNTPLGEKINHHLKTNCKDYENIHCYLRDFIFMKLVPDTELQLFVSLLYVYLR